VSLRRAADPGGVRAPPRGPGAQRAASAARDLRAFDAVHADALHPAGARLHTETARSLETMVRGRGRRQLTSPPRAGPQRRARPLFGASLALRPAAPVCPGLASGPAVPLTAPCSGLPATPPALGALDRDGVARRDAARTRGALWSSSRCAASLLIALQAGARGPARAKVVTRAHAAHPTDQDPGVARFRAAVTCDRTPVCASGTQRRCVRQRESWWQRFPSR
jgi:hypothetical protein